MLKDDKHGLQSGLIHYSGFVVNRHKPETHEPNTETANGKLEFV